MQLSDVDKILLILLVEEVLLTCKYDETDSTVGLGDIALSAGQILGLSKDYMDSLE